jgi:hypothetical protein
MALTVTTVVHDKETIHLTYAYDQHSSRSLCTLKPDRDIDWQLQCSQNLVRYSHEFALTIVNLLSTPGSGNTVSHFPRCVKANQNFKSPSDKEAKTSKVRLDQICTARYAQSQVVLPPAALN